MSTIKRRDSAIYWITGYNGHCFPESVDSFEIFIKSLCVVNGVIVDIYYNKYFALEQRKLSRKKNLTKVDSHCPRKKLLYQIDRFF